MCWVVGGGHREDDRVGAVWVDGLCLIQKGHAEDSEKSIECDGHYGLL